MKRVIHLLTHLYQRLLCLYPAHFRDTFADEMQTVFTLAVKENTDRVALLRFILREAINLPISLCSQHWHEYSRSATLAYQGGMTMTSYPSTRVFRWTIHGSLGLFILFAVLVILPFFALGLHTQPVNLVLSGHFDPKGFSLYSDNAQSENVLYVLTIMVALITPFVGIVFSIASGVRLLTHWRSLNLKQHLMGGAALLIGTSLLLFLFSPFGRIIFTWLLD